MLQQGLSGVCMRCPCLHLSSASILLHVQRLPKKLHSIKVQVLGIAGLSWSPDDSLILVSGTGEETHVYIYHTEVGGRVKDCVGGGGGGCMTLFTALYLYL